MALELQSLPLRSDGRLIHYWKLEDVAAEVGGVTLTNNNTVAFNAGIFTNGADFSNANSDKHLSAASDLGITGGVCTFSFWIKLSAEIGSGSWAFFSQGDAGNDVFYYVEYQYNAGTRRLAFHRNKSGTADDNFTHNITLGTSGWYHIAQTYDGTTVRGYVNGVEVGSGVASSGNGSGSGVDEFHIASTWIPDAFTSAIIDDFSVWNDALTLADIQQIYSGTVPQTGSYAFIM